MYFMNVHILNYYYIFLLTESTFENNNEEMDISDEETDTMLMEWNNHAWESEDCFSGKDLMSKLVNRITH